MNNPERPLASPGRIKLSLGPFVGAITTSSVKIWINVESEGTDKNVYVSLKRTEQAPRLAREYKSEADIKPVSDRGPGLAGVITCTREHLGTGVVTIDNLQPNSKYFYQLWEDEAHTIPLLLNPPDLDLEAPRDDVRMPPEQKAEDLLTEDDLYFWTLPEDGFARQLDFLLMSCHHPATAANDGSNGFGIWREIPQIMAQNENVRFAILAGDQVYADEVEAEVLEAKDDPLKRRELYLRVYRKFWNNNYYRKVLCRLPAVLMWDDHDITDGWGSRDDSYDKERPQEFATEWQELFGTASEMFGIMQAARNPDPLATGVPGFDTCFQVGRAGFAVADLRTNRIKRHKLIGRRGKENVYEGKIWEPEQREAIRRWVAEKRDKIDTLFFVSSVVFSHGAPVIENWIGTIWIKVLQWVKRIERLRLFTSGVAWFNSNIGDLRDDIDDSWGSEINQAEAERVLEFLFDLINPKDGSKRVNVVILSGDIHTPGYSTIYSARKQDNETTVDANGKERKGRAVIPHIVATPVAYEPFSWIGEAVFRHLTKVVALGKSVEQVDTDRTQPRFTSQVSHHFCYRNVVVVSLRNYGGKTPEQDESHLKVKYYLEHFPEPQIMLFDLVHGARREAIKWPQVSRNSRMDRLPAWIKRRLPQTFFPESERQRTRVSPTEEIPVTPIDLPELTP